jgi:NAD(P)-dependent dehydrogenase (short-subunit alcohol dehydrogenase family)
MRTNVLISGASSGLGEGMARLFAAKGHNLHCALAASTGSNSCAARWPRHIRMCG